MRGNDNRILNNYIYGLQQINNRHPDFIYMGNSPTQRNLIEGLWALGTPTAPDNKWFWMENYGSGGTTNNIIRRNVGHNIGSGGIGHGNNSPTYPVNYTRIYNNTAVDLSRSWTGVPYGTAVIMGTGATNVSVFNNLSYEAWTSDTVNNIQVFYFANAATYDYNLAYDTNPSATYGATWTAQTHRWQTNPSFTDYANDDFTIGNASSAAIGNAGSLTTTSGSGTGTTFNVVLNGGGFFMGDNPNLSQYGSNLVPGDWITVGSGGMADTVQISSISGNAITVTSSFTWENAEPVYFGKSDTPDIGAYPYKAGGYSLTGTYTKSGATVTVVPNDSTLVRWAIVYEDGIPKGVVNSSPYSVSGIGNGIVTVKLYSLYPSATPVVNAAFADTIPPDTTPSSAPTGLTVL